MLGARRACVKSAASLTGALANDSWQPARASVSYRAFGQPQPGWQVPDAAEPRRNKHLQ